MDSEEFKDPTKAYAIRIVRLVESLPKSKAADVVGGQLLRCGTSVGANYRAACRARSHADFIAKLGIVEEECDESIYWIEILVALGMVEAKKVAELQVEGAEILSMVVASITTARARRK